MARTVVCLRYFLLVYVILLGISGVIVSIGSGIFVYQLKEYHPLTPEGAASPGITLLVMGLTTCLLGWCGWHVMEFTHRVQIIGFAVTLGIVAIVEAGIGIWALIKYEEIDALRTPALETIFALAITEEKAIWDKMQMRLRCCGIDGPADYRIIDSVPWSCCDTTSLASSSNTAGVCTTMYARGCQHPVVSRARSILLHIFLLALCSVIVQVSGVISSCFFARAIKEGTDRRRRVIMSIQNAQTPSLPQTLPSSDMDPDSQLVVRTAKNTRTKT